MSENNNKSPLPTADELLEAISKLEKAEPKCHDVAQRVENLVKLGANYNFDYAEAGGADAFTPNAAYAECMKGEIAQLK